MKAYSFSSVASAITRHDLALEKRRATRLARESLRRNQSEAAALGIAPDRTYVAKRRNPMSAMVSASAAIFSSFHAAPMRARRPLPGGQRTPVAKRGTERSRTQTTIIDPAGSIRDFSAQEATRRAERAARAAQTRASKEGKSFVDKDEDVTPALPQFMSPEPVTPDLASVLNKVPNLAPPLPSLPRTHKKLSPGWLKCTYGGDYSKYQLDTRDYLRGTRGVGYTYARIISERNSTLSQNSRKKLHWFIQKATGGPRPISTA